MFLPFFLMAPIAGVLADRFPRRYLMILADLVRMTVFLFFAYLIALTQDWGRWGPFLPLLPVGLMAAVFSPSRCALLPTLIRPDQLVRANALLSGLGIIFTMTAIGVGGYLADNYEPTVAFNLDAVTFLVSAGLLFVLKPPRHAEDQAEHAAGQSTSSTSAKTNFREGMKYIMSHKHVLQLIMIAMIVWFCGPLVKSVVPAIAVNSYQGTFKDISFYLIMIAVGFVIGAALMAWIGNRVRSYAPMTIGLWGIGLAMIVLASSVFLPLDLGWRRFLGAISLVGAGFCAVITMASFNALLQRTVPNRFRGRVYGVKDVACIGALLTASGSLAIPQWSNLDAWVGYILIAVAFITIAAGTFVLVGRFNASSLPPLLTVTYDINDFITRFWWRGERIGINTVPRQGPVIITANHRCHADPCFLGMAAPHRRISFIIAAEYTRLPVVNYLVWILGCIPVKRDGSDTAATKQALRHLKNGNCMGIFIEGGIVGPGTTPTPKDGIAMLALRSGAAVVPTYISGTIYREGMFSGLMTRHRMRIRFGKPVDLSEFQKVKGDREMVRAATNKIYQAIWALKPEEDETESVPVDPRQTQPIPDYQQES
ncbi:MAG: MFS transporter, partial [Planctomycetota bacterium]|jgi:1-acyl-sn-glycerol-3-phosphate acyltransferase